jgi:hypothetical protein
MAGQPKVSYGQDNPIELQKNPYSYTDENALGD